MGLRRWIFQLAYGRRLPTVSGELRTPGLAGPITIRRDKYGLACIEAGNDDDANFGIGFCQGQDRGFQLETLLRIVRGTMAELVGEEGFPVDRMSRRIGFHRAAKAQYKLVDADVKAMLVAFCAGVNAGHTVGMLKPAHEFALLKAEPTRYEPADVLGLLKLMSFSLPANWDVELARLRILRSDGVEALKALDPAWLNPPHPPSRQVGTTTSPTGGEVKSAAGFSTSPLVGEVDSRSESGGGASLSALAEDVELFQKFVPRGGGSNNWLIAGSRTHSGKPILASDPHLAPNIPPPWYMVQVRTPNSAKVGAVLAGSPVVAIGHNGFAAWGVTAGLTDNTDLFLETLGSDGKSVRTADGSFLPCELLREVIRVKNGPEQVEEVLVTPRGPIISPLLQNTPEAISLRAIWLEPLPLRGLLDAAKATSFESFRRPFAQWPCLPLNMLYADEAGEIGYQLVGQLPIRTLGHGTLPMPADAPSAGWKQELVPFDEMPFLRNPEAGYLGTANSDPKEISPSPAFLGVDFIDGYRARLIRDELGKRATLWDVPDCLKMQMNVRSGPWEEIREIVLNVPAETSEAGEAIELLKAWNGHVEAESPAASVYELFVSEMCIRVAKAKAPNSWALALGGQGKGLFAHNLFGDRRTEHLVKLQKSQPTGWFTKGWPAEMVDALGSVIAMLKSKFGPGPEWWQWGSLRTLNLTHTLLGKHWLLGPLFNIEPVPCAGDCNTISQAGAVPLTPLQPTHNLSNLRTAFDTSNWSNSRAILCGGQSGNPFSKHYRDQFALWQSGDAVPLPFTSEEVLKAAVSTLRLLPG